MAESLVQDWLAEFEELLEPSQLKSFFLQNEENHEITSAIFAVLGEPHRFPEVSVPCPCACYYIILLPGPARTIAPRPEQ